MEEVGTAVKVFFHNYRDRMAKEEKKKIEAEKKKSEEDKREREKQTFVT